MKESSVRVVNGLPNVELNNGRLMKMKLIKTVDKDGHPRLYGNSPGAYAYTLRVAGDLRLQGYVSSPYHIDKMFASQTVIKHGDNYLKWCPSCGSYRHPLHFPLKKAKDMVMNTGPICRACELREKRFDARG